MWNPNYFGHSYQYEDASHYYEEEDIQDMLSRMHLNAPQAHEDNQSSFDGGEYSSHYQNHSVSELGSVSQYENTQASPPYQPSYGYAGHSYYPPPMPLYQPYYSYGTARSLPGATLDLVSGRGENGCAICAIACALGKSYDDVRPYAVAKGFTSGEGMTYREMKNTVKALGGKAKIRYADEWAEVADLAIVSIRNPSGVMHAVVFERNDAGRFIYDSNKNAPYHRPDDLALGESMYLKIVKD